jgi:glycosyltransferase involved in cell wall biosynthesis
MPFRNEAASLPRVLASLAEQRFDLAAVRLIAVDNGSTDGGATLVTTWLTATGLAGEVLAIGPPSIPSALNAALARAWPAEHVVRIDAHTVYAPDYLATIAAAFARLGPDVWCVGGAPGAEGADDLWHALHVALYTNPMGMGPADFRMAREEQPVSSVYLGAWRPGVLQRLGGFDERWRANEDAELAERVRAAGGKVWWVPARSTKLLTRDARAALAQWTRYGIWRSRTLRRHPRALRLRHVLPPAMLAAMLAVLFSPIRVLLLPIAGAYAGATIAGRRATDTPLLTAASLLFFPLVHAGYALGLIAGALLPWRPKREP